MIVFDCTQLQKQNLKSKLLNEYFKLKNNNPGCVLLIQIGNFYETFFSDAKLFSELTGATLTYRYIKEVGKIAMAGVNRNNVNSFLKVLLNNDLKVCVCAEFCNERGVFSRKRIRTFSIFYSNNFC